MNFFIPSKKELKMNSSEVTKSFNSTHKDAIRKFWNEPVLKFLTKKADDRLVYMGLPSSAAEDILQWIEYIKRVVAFQCRVYGEISSPDQSRDEIEKLESILRELERKQKLEQFVVYDGYLEEVILRKNDNSPHRIDFDQRQIITLYNLDFCNKITSPMEYIDENGEVQIAYKFNAIRELIQIQDKLSPISQKFIFLLTVHCSYDGKELNDFLQNPPSQTYSDLIAKYRTLNGVEKNARIVRLFVLYEIEKFFNANNFISEIFPVIKYNGLKDTPLLHFMVAGIKSKPSASGAHNIQNIDDIVKQKFVVIEDGKITNIDSELEEEVDVPIKAPVDLLVQSKTFKTHWMP